MLRRFFKQIEEHALSISSSIHTVGPITASAELAGVKSSLVLRPRSGFSVIQVGRLWHYRDLLRFLAMRDVKVRYKQTVLGALWAILQPFVMMVVLSLFLGHVIDVEMSDKTRGIPYPIFLYAGLLPWTFFAAAVNASTNSLVANAGMLRKVYFPRLILPLSAIGAPLVDYVLAFGILFGLMVWYGVPPTAGLLLLPAFALLTILAALGVGIGLSGLTVSYRDFRHVVPFMLQVWFYITPVIWPVTIVDERYHWLLRLNPMGGTIEAFRAAVLGTPIDTTALIISSSVTALCLLGGLIYFSRAERRFADVI